MNEVIRFVTQVSRSGKKLYIVVPLRYHDKIKHRDVVLVEIRQVLSQ